MGWIGVDLDGTLAEYGTWQGPEHIGPPIPKMVFRVKKWLSEGKEVRIMTARAALCEDISPDSGVAGDQAFVDTAIAAIERWCEEHIGQKLPVTCMKDYAMIELWDDRAVQVIPDTGERADGRRG